MTRKKIPDGRQEAMFLVGPDQQIVEPVHEPGAVGLADRAIYLGQALDYLMQANMRDAFAGNEQAQKKYGSQSELVAEGAVRNAEQYRRLAKWVFLRAYGVAPADGYDKSELLKSFDMFKEGIGDISGERKSLKQIREELHRTLKVRVGLQNRQQNARPHKAEPQPKTPNKQASNDNGLPTREKLIAISEDQRAGFITPTNLEKNLVMAYLDYFDNPEFELGPQNQLIEVVNFQLKHHGPVQGKEYGHQAGRSIAYVFADFYEQATRQLADLEYVRERLQETDNPNLSLAVALNADMLKAIPLIRYMDLAEYRATGEVAYQQKDKVIRPGFSILRSRRNEDAASGDKNKIIEDPYTARNRSKAATKWLKTRLEQIKVGDVRGVIGYAILDQQKREIFHEVVLKDFAEEKTRMPQLAEARKVARRVLGMAA